ncbi:hypothetical protein PVA46_05935 [Entomospira culicis]|nr:hypothetical protein PVA46_05935 [Entomospira culicis]
MMVSCNPKAQTPNPEVPNPEVPNPEVPNPENPNPEDPNPEDPNPETPTDIPVPNFGNGPIFTAVDTQLDFSNSDRRLENSVKLLFEYVPVRSFQHYEEEILKAGIWQNKKERYNHLMSFSIRSVGGHVASLPIKEPHGSIVRFDFSNPQDPKVESFSSSNDSRPFRYNQLRPGELNFTRWTSQDEDIIAHNAAASDAYKIHPNEEFYVVIVAHTLGKPNLSYSLYIPINTNGLSHSTYTLEE